MSAEKESAMQIDLSRSIEIVDLSHPMTTGMPNFPSAPEFRLLPYYRLGDFELDGGYWGCNEALTMSGHSGTHLDALGHVAQDGLLYDGVRAEDAQNGIDGLVAHSISDVDPIVARGVLLDAAAGRRVEVLDGAVGIGADELAALATAAGVEIVPGDCVLIRTGWERFWPEPERYLGEATGLPGITVDGLDWLADRGVRLVGSDTGVVEVTNPGSLYLPVHMQALARRGVHLLENLALGGLIERPPQFAFVCSPLKIAGSSGSPVRPIALFQS
jgi:kynurenine formamidase